MRALASAALRAFLAGGILLNMLKEALFGAQEGRVVGVRAGRAGYRSCSAAVGAARGGDPGAVLVWYDGRSGRDAPRGAAASTAGR